MQVPHAPCAVRVRRDACVRSTINRSLKPWFSHCALKKYTLGVAVKVAITKCEDWERMLVTFGDFSRSSMSRVKERVRAPVGFTLAQRMRCKHRMTVFCTEN